MDGEDSSVGTEHLVHVVTLTTTSILLPTATLPMFVGTICCLVITTTMGAIAIVLQQLYSCRCVCLPEILAIQRRATFGVVFMERTPKLLHLRFLHWFLLVLVL